MFGGGSRFYIYGIIQFLIALSYVFTEDFDESDVKKSTFVAPNVPENAYLVLYFTSPSDLTKKMVLSKARKDGIDEALSKYDGKWSVEVPRLSALDGDYGLVLQSKAKHHAVSIKLNKPISFNLDEIVIQYEVKYQEKMECGGAYIKLLSALHKVGEMQENFNDKTPYTIMFGPDKCGFDEKFHFIIRHKNPITGEFEEKHAKKPSASLEKYFSDGKTHLYTLVLRSDNTFKRYIDLEEVQSGNLLKDMEPPINPSLEIDDPLDIKPEDWDDNEQIVDKTATKPEDWDESLPEFIEDTSATKPEGWLDNEPEMISDPSAKPPTDWDEDMDGKWDAPQIKNPNCENSPGCGQWKAPMIKNPKYKGKWFPPLIKNPNYKGVWVPRKIPNPNYFEDQNPFRNLVEVNALGLELWSMTNEVVFDNFLIVDSKQVADDFAYQTWSIKYKTEKAVDSKSQSVWDLIVTTFQEKPWIIIIIGLVITIPITFCCFYMCRSSQSTDLHKKTDQYTPLDHCNGSPKSTDEELEESVGDEDIASLSKASGEDSDAQVRPSGDESTEDKIDKSKQVRKRRSRKD